jgi:2-dehydropantoate 2-reductase
VVIVAGTGALGTLLAARLGAVTPVTVLGSWPEGLDALARDGAALESDGAVLVSRVRATSDPAAASGAPLALVAVKASTTARVAAVLRTALAPNGVAVSLQNGLGNVETLAAALGPERVVAGAAEVGAMLVAPGRARAGGGNLIRLAEHPRTPEIAGLLRQAGFDVSVEADSRAVLWRKLATSAPLLPLTALLGVANGEIARRPSAAAILAQAALEVATVARAAGISFEGNEPVGGALRVAETTEANLSSMLQDVRAGRPTEVNAVTGAVVREGKRLGIPTPVLETLALAVAALSEGGRA